LTSGLP